MLIVPEKEIAGLLNRAESFAAVEKVFAAIAEFSRGLHSPHDDITLLTVRKH